MEENMEESKKVKTEEAAPKKKKSKDSLLIEEKDKEIALLNDKYLRLAAEYDNYRKRTVKEKESLYTEAICDAVKEILTVLDNIERASAYTGDAEKVAEGLAMTAKSAKSMLAKLGIEEFGMSGDKFNPDFHNAVMHVDDDSFGEGVVAEVFQCGYKRGDKIIRYAMVKVAN